MELTKEQIKEINDKCPSAAHENGTKTPTTFFVT
jgi:hypothetical protein